MATVDGKTSIKIDELINGSVVSGTIAANGHLILTTRGGAQLDAGFLAKPFVGRWTVGVAYKIGDVVGYAGMTWQALQDSTSYAPAFYTDHWQRISGDDGSNWVERDPYFDGNTLSGGGDWEVFWKTAGVVTEFTSVAGEFETGNQALKSSCPAGGSQRFYARDENVVRDGEVITVSVRARLQASAPTATLSAELFQNDKTNFPGVFVSGASITTPAEGSMNLTTSWKTYTFTFIATAAKPRAIINFIVAADAETATFFLDRIRIGRATGPSLQAWPIGSIFFSANNTNPAELLGGGTWVAWGAGRMPVGFDAAQGEFDTAEETGGSKTHTLTAAEMPDHTHGVGTLATASGGNHEHTITRKAGVGSSTGVARGNATADADATTTFAGVHTHTLSGATASAGSGAAHNNLPPYIVCYMWKRTA